MAGTLRIDDEAELDRRVAAGDCYEVSQLYIGHIARLRQAERFEEAEVTSKPPIAHIVESPVRCYTEITETKSRRLQHCVGLRR
jgi:hypothetical protein